ncbi:MAG: ATP-binding protein [Sulfurovum sp.]|nr:ATP-binding protein [Sulfurovum sp.]
MTIEFSNIETLLQQLNDNIYLEDITWIEPIGIAILKLYKVVNPEIQIHLTGKDNAINYCKTILNSSRTPAQTYTPFSQFDNEINSIAKDVTSKIIQNTHNLTTEDRKDLSEYLRYLVSEMMDNVVSHAQSHCGGYITAQYYPQKKKVQVVIIDNGLGLKQTLSHKYPLENESDAISKALEEKVTGSNVFSIYNNVPKHAGLGLFFLTKIIQETDGKLFIVSNNTIYHLKDNSFTELQTSFNGTIICFEIEVDKINHDLKDLMSIIMHVDEEEDIF